MGIPEKSILTFFIVIILILVVVANILIQVSGLQKALIVPFYQLLLFAFLVFLFTIYLMDRTIELKEILRRAIITFSILIIWSFLSGLLSFLAISEKSFGECIKCAFSSLPVFLVSMIFALLIAFMQWKLFSGPMLKLYSLSRGEKEEVSEGEGGKKG
ncbi:MAG: hypothetical protein ACPL6C_03980, partial [bacterium]